MQYLKQNRYYYSVGKYNKPALTIKDGETLTVETLDYTGNLIKTEKDKGVLEKLDKWNPLSGPILIEDAKPGDTLSIFINDIIPLRGQGSLGQIPGGVSSAGKDMINKRIPYTLKICRIIDKKIKIPLTTGKIINIPLKPFIGTIGTSFEVDSYPSMVCTSHGGNMDSPDICKGNILFLPVSVDGAYLYLGDVHAIQGDGELNSSAVEVSAKCILTVGIIKNKIIKHPRIETPEHIITVGNARPLDRACSIATTEMIYWLEKEYGFVQEDAIPLIGILSRIRVNQVANPINGSLSVMFPKKYLSNNNG